MPAFTHHHHHLHWNLHLHHVPLAPTYIVLARPHLLPHLLSIPNHSIQQTKPRHNSLSIYYYYNNNENSQDHLARLHHQQLRSSRLLTSTYTYQPTTTPQDYQSHTHPSQWPPHPSSTCLSSALRSFLPALVLPRTALCLLSPRAVKRLVLAK